MLRTLNSPAQVAVIGASGGIGNAVVEVLVEDPGTPRIWAASRRDTAFTAKQVTPLRLDVTDEATVAQAAAEIAASGQCLDLVLVATGLLHDGDALQPEKTWRALQTDAMARAFEINCIGPAIVAKHLLPLLARERKAVFAAISARVGSIGENRLGGWYSYRASKAALNMTIRTLAIELARRHPSAVCVALHPGTVDTELSKPFQRGVEPDRLFKPTRAARHLLAVVDDLTPEQSGGFYSWDGSTLAF